ncbi:MAG: hypothetical protein DCF20_20375 [Pseudanabaena sp.]|nr:MAG: hypothetical protein DCF20_20375 [Pseudanabaena sp.]
MGWELACIPEMIDIGGILSDGDWIESKDQDPEGNVRLIQLADIGVGKYLDKSNRFLTEEKAKQLNCTFLNEGDILIARMPDPLGRACLFPSNERKCVTVVDVCIIRSGNNGVNHRWLMHTINSPIVRNEIEIKASGTTRQRISKSNLSSIKLPIPPLNEQRRIVDKVEALMARSRKAKEALDAIPKLIEQFRQSVLAAAFRGDLTADWREQNPNIEPASVLLENNPQQKLFKEKNTNELPDPFPLPQEWV